MTYDRSKQSLVGWQYHVWNIFISTFEGRGFAGVITSFAARRDSSREKIRFICVNTALQNQIFFAVNTLRCITLPNKVKLNPVCHSEYE